jgi:hypothetical protein
MFDSRKHLKKFKQVLQAIGWIPWKLKHTKNWHATARIQTMGLWIASPEYTHLYYT